MGSWGGVKGLNQESWHYMGQGRGILPYHLPHGTGALGETALALEWCLDPRGM